MKKIFTFIGAALLVASAAQVQAQRNTVHPSVAAGDTSRVYQAPKATSALTIDGLGNEASWALAPWKTAFAISPADANSWPVAGPVFPVAPEGAFSGVDDVNFKYKIIWDDNYYYLLVRYTDDKIIYGDKHNGYRTGYTPAFMTGVVVPSTAGGGDGTVFQSFRMDMFGYWLTPYTVALAGGATYSRANNGIIQNFYPGKITESTIPESVLWAPKHNPISTTTGAPQDHVGTVAGTYNATEKAYYIEFRDDTWATLFSTVRTKLADQKLYSATVLPVIGDKFLMQLEVNDADGNTNRRDYVNYGSQLTNASTKNPLTNLSEAMVIELVNTVTGLSNPKANNSLEIFPNVTAGNTITLSRAADVQFFNLSGHMKLESKNATVINISGLKQGIYMVKDSQGNVNKLVRN